MIQVGEEEVLLNDSLRMAKNTQAAGVDVAAFVRSRVRA
jgi:hypothetical protein